VFVSFSGVLHASRDYTALRIDLTKSSLNSTQVLEGKTLPLKHYLELSVVSMSILVKVFRFWVGLGS
jgi:hypothetical protein